MAETNRQSVLFPEALGRPTEVAFDEPTTTSDGGAVLLRSIDDSLGVTESVSGVVLDTRQAGKIDHELVDLVRQRVYAIACGYPDANDSSRLKRDPLHKALLRRDPYDGLDLASQPTLSRFENSVTRTELWRIGSHLADRVFLRHKRRFRGRKVKRITIDLDGSVDPTHGAQQGTLFNGYYDTWCYFPQFGFVSFNDESEQYLFSAILRPGRAKETQGALGVLRRAVPRLRELFPKARIVVRLDAGFQGPKLFEVLEELRVLYLVGIPKNAVLTRETAPLIETARTQADAEGQSVTLFGEMEYSAKSWKGKERRVVIKAEALRTEGMTPKDNPRYVVTNMRRPAPKTIYTRYCGRGDAENRIKELKDGVQVDRTSCHRFEANQLRVFLASAAYILLQELRLRAARTELARSQVWVLQLQLLKIAGRVYRSVRRQILHLSEHHPWKDVWLRIAHRCGAIQPST